MIHLTINTGHSRVSQRAEVADDVIEMLRPLVRAGGGRLPGPPGYSLKITRAGRDAAFTINLVGEGNEEAPLVTCVLAVDDPPAAWHAIGTLLSDRSIAALALNHRYHGAMPLSMPASLPWLAVMIHPTVAVEAAALPWLGDLERCLAWAIIEDAR